MRVAISGGHLTPAVALMEYLRSLGDHVDFFGRDFSSVAYGIKSHEESEVKRFGYDFYQLPEAKLDRYNLGLSLLKIPQHVVAVIEARNLLRTLNSDIVVSFGGYLGLHLAIAGWSLGLPVVLHEQTQGAGLANRLASRFAGFVGVSYQSSLRYFLRANTEVTGNLVRAAFFDPEVIVPDWWSGRIRQPIIYITGGNQGSIQMNELIQSLLPKLVTDFFVVHQTGSSNREPSYEAMLASREALPKRYQRRYIVQPWFELPDVVWLMRHARLVISRSGANSIAELMVAKTPSILLPLAGVSGDEQYLNARLLADVGCAEVLQRKDITPERLLQKIAMVYNNQRSYVRHFAKLDHSHSLNSVRRFYASMQRLLATTR